MSLGPIAPRCLPDAGRLRAGGGAPPSLEGGLEGVAAVLIEAVLQLGDAVEGAYINQLANNGLLQSGGHSRGMHGVFAHKERI